MFVNFVCMLRGLRMHSIMAAYRNLIASKNHKYDQNQFDAIQRLQELDSQLVKYSTSFRGPPPKGMYIHGGVGSGKSMVMGTFL